MHAFGRVEEGTALGDFDAVLCEICGIPEIFPRFLKSVMHIPEEQHLGLASLPTCLTWSHIIQDNFLTIFNCHSNCKSQIKLKHVD